MSPKVLTSLPFPRLALPASRARGAALGAALGAVRGAALGAALGAVNERRRSRPLSPQARTLAL
jgi:hypothetical protein